MTTTPLFHHHPSARRNVLQSPARTLLSALSALLLATACSRADADAGATMAVAAVTAPTIPAPALDIPLAAAPGGESIAVFAGGCFWGVEGVFEHVAGVTRVESGYSGGSAGNADYASVSSGNTRHAESVLVTWDPSRVSYGTLLHVFFSVIHDPTQLNRQGPDIGPHYRSQLFPRDAEQDRIARAYIAQLQAAHVYANPIVTALEPFKAFYPAEPYHQDYMRKHPGNPYIVYHDAPKVAALKRQFPTLYRTAHADDE